MKWFFIVLLFVYGCSNSNEPSGLHINVYDINSLQWDLNQYEFERYLQENDISFEWNGYGFQIDTNVFIAGIQAEKLIVYFCNWYKSPACFEFRFNSLKANDVSKIILDSKELKMKYKDSFRLCEIGGFYVNGTIYDMYSFKFIVAENVSKKISSISFFRD